VFPANLGETSSHSKHSYLRSQCSCISKIRATWKIVIGLRKIIQGLKEKLAKGINMLQMMTLSPLKLLLRIVETKNMISHVVS
jgi:hypothetical protein